MAARANKKFSVEIARIRSLYVTALHSFQKTAKSLLTEIQKGNVDPRQPYSIHLESPAASFTAINAYMFSKKLTSQFPRYLRETLLVRLISALEVFLIARIRELFLARRDLFHSDQRVEFAVGELLAAESPTDLWSKVISRELRKLQNQGFAEIVRYYRTRLGIDLNQSPVPLGYIDELNIRRHLLVHRLGRTDDEYRHRYNTKNKVVSITSENLLECLDRTLVFVEFVDREANSRASSASVATVHREEVQAALEIVVCEGAPSTTEIFDRDYIFYVDDRLVRMADILRTHHVEGAAHHLVIAGPRDAVRGFLRDIKQRAKHGELEIVSRSTTIYGSHSVNSGLAPEKLRELALDLPAEPWPRDFHKVVARKHGLSNRRAWDALTEIRSDDALRALLKISKGADSQTEKNSIDQGTA
jgi:hypothetical protein